MAELLAHGITLVNIKVKPTPSYTAYIGRPNAWLNLEGSIWQNPFHLKKESEREEVLEKYREHIESNPVLISALPKLRFQTLACYCSPKRCHGNVLIELYDKYYGSKTFFELSEDRQNDLIDCWHESDDQMILSISEYLALTPDEYKHYILLGGL